MLLLLSAASPTATSPSVCCEPGRVSAGGADGAEARRGSAAVLSAHPVSGLHVFEGQEPATQGHRQVNQQVFSAKNNEEKGAGALVKEPVLSAKGGERERMWPGLWGPSTCLTLLLL